MALFDSQTGSSMFGGMSTASSAPVVGSSMSAIGASSSPGFVSTVQSNPFGISSQQQSEPPAFGSLPAFGNTGSEFGTSVNGSSTPVFGVSSTPASGASSSPSLAGSSLVCPNPSSGGGFGSTTQSSPFGSSFQQQSQPSFGASSTPAFGASSTRATGNTGSTFGTSVFGSSTPAFGASSSPSFGASPAFGASSIPVFWRPPTHPFREGGFDKHAGHQESAPSFWSHGFGQPSLRGQLREGTRVTSYTQTNEYDTNTTVTLKSISAMPAYIQKSHEELRWADYKLGDKGNALFHYPPEFWKAALCYSAFGAAFVSTSLFGPATSSYPFGRPSSSAFGTQAQGTTSSFGIGFNNGSTQSSPLFQSFTPTPGQTSSSFGQATPFYGQNTPPVCGNLHSMGVDQKTSSTPFQPAVAEPVQSHIQQSTPFGQTAPSSGQSYAFGENMVSSSPSLLSTSSMGLDQKTPSLSTPFQSTQPTQNTGGFSYTPQTASGGTSSIHGQDIFRQSTRSERPILSQQSITSPFGILPATPVDNKPSPMRKSCLSNSQKHIAKKDPHKKVSFNDENLTTCKIIEANCDQFMSISAMCAYKEKSHEELRWENYQVGDKGNIHCGCCMNNIQPPNPFVPTSTYVFGTQAQGTSSSFGSTQPFPLFQSNTPTFGQTSCPFGQHVLVIHQHFYTNHKDSA